MDIFIVRYIMEYGFLILHWMVKRQFYVIQLGGGDIDWGSVFCLRRGVREECALNEFDTIVDNLYRDIWRRWCWRHRMQNDYRFLCLYLFNGK
jgi:hypothetical protein